MTSAPIAASHAVAAGPAQKAVKSSTRTPTSGRSPLGAPGSRAGAGQPSPDSASLGATSSRSATPWKRNGARGRIQDSPGCCTSTSRSIKWSNCGSSAPLPTMIAGTRASTQASTASSAVCSPVHARNAPLTSAARWNRPIIVPSSVSSAMSSRPITRASAFHCCSVTVVMPTKRPSPVGSLPGIITQRKLPIRPPGKRAISVGTIVNVMWIASSIDTSTTSGIRVRDARVQAVAAPSVAYAPVTYSPRRPPTVSGGRFA